MVLPRVMAALMLLSPSSALTNYVRSFQNAQSSCSTHSSFVPYFIQIQANTPQVVFYKLPFCFKGFFIAVLERFYELSRVFFFALSELFWIYGPDTQKTIQINMHNKCRCLLVTHLHIKAHPYSGLTLQRCLSCSSSVESDIFTTSFPSFNKSNLIQFFWNHSPSPCWPWGQISSTAAM